MMFVGCLKFLNMLFVLAWWLRVVVCVLLFCRLFWVCVVDVCLMLDCFG